MSCAYEPLVFTFKDKSRYVPDFLVSTRVFVEVKGLWTSEAKKKVLAFQEQFSEFPLVVLDNKALTRITKKQR